MIINAKTEKEYKLKINELRLKGWFLITYRKRFAELTKGGRMVVIER